MLPRWVLISVLTVALAGCGFHLRGTATLSDTFARTRIEGVPSYDSLYEALRTLLELNDVQVVTPGQDEATAVVRILSANRATEVMGISGTGKAESFQMIYRVGFSASAAAGDTLLEPQEITLYRSYEYDPTEVLGRENAEAVEFQAMLRDAAWQIVERLSAVK